MILRRLYDRQTDRHFANFWVALNSLNFFSGMRKWEETQCHFLVPKYFIISFLWLSHKPGLGPRKENMNFLFLDWPIIQLMKKKRMPWICSLPWANISNVPTVHTWLLNFPHPYTVSDRMCKLPVILRMWDSPYHPSRWAWKHLSGQPCLQSSSWYPFHPYITKDMKEGKDTETLASSKHIVLFSVQYHSFQDVFEKNWKTSS